MGHGGGPAGDVYVEIVEIEHEYLIRDRDTLHMSLSISMTAAALGTKVSVESLDGLVDVHIKAGTQNGAPIVIKGKGMGRLRNGGRGDFIVHIEVATPTKLNREEEELLKKFAKLRGESAGDAHVKSHDGGTNALPAPTRCRPRESPQRMNRADGVWHDRCSGQGDQESEPWRCCVSSGEVRRSSGPRSSPGNGSASTSTRASRPSPSGSSGRLTCREPSARSLPG